MMKSEEIARWFRLGRNFRAGVALLDKYGVDTTRFLPYLNNRIISDFYTDFLLQEIKRLSTIPSPVIKNQGATTISRKEEDPPIIKDLRHKMRRLYDEYKSLHGQMKVVARMGNETFERPRRILEIFEEIAPIGELLKKWEKSGTVPPMQAVENKEGVKLLEKQKRLTYLNERISRYRDDASKKKEIAAAKIERDTLKSELAYFNRKT